MKLQNNLLYTLCFLLLGLAFSSNSFAQPYTLDPAVKPIKLEFQTYEPPNEPKAKGRMNITEVNQTKDTMYYYMNGVSIFSPTYFSIDTDDPDANVRAGIFKTTWTKAHRGGKTDKKGHWNTSFKTGNDFGIMVITDKTPINYSMLVWTGDDKEVEMPSLFREPRKNELPETGKNSASNSNQSDSGGGGNGGGKTPFLLYGLIGVMALFMLYMFIQLQKKKS